MKRADLTMHGSAHERRMWALQAQQVNNDKKPNGFLSRSTKPVGSAGRGPRDPRR